MSDIAELMRRDPLNLSKDDITALIAEFRAKRGQFNMGNIKAGSTKPATPKQKQLTGLAASLDLKLDI